MSKRSRSRKQQPRPVTEPAPGVSQSASADVPTSESGDEPRGRPGRRSADDRTEAVLDLMSGKATVEQISRRLGVQPETVLKWREAALEGIGQSLRQGDKSPRERELERELKDLKHAFTRLAIKHEIVERELSKRPTPPGRSSR